MKRILFSILIAFVIICLYLLAASVFVLATGSYPTPGSYIDLPLRLPKIIFYYFSPPNQQDFASGFSTRKLIVGLVAFLGNLIVYSIPVYIVLSLFGKKKVEFHFETPPPPPLFLKDE